MPKRFDAPSISMFDKDGYLPVNLQRTWIQGPLPFQSELVESIAEDLAAFALVEAPNTCETPWLNGTYEGFSNRADWPRWMIARDGFLLNDPLLLKEFSPKILIIAIGGGSNRSPWGESLRFALPPAAAKAKRDAEDAADEESRGKNNAEDRQQADET
jgi:hypothetical protein